MAQGVAVAIDVTAATAVLDAVCNPALSVAQALAIARLPGNRGLIRKAISYGRAADETIFAQALVAAAHHDAAASDVGEFHFERVRDSRSVIAS